MTTATKRDHVERHLPLKPVVFHILLALAENDRHGYGVIQSVRERSEGRIALQTGPFYRHLNKLMDDGLVQEATSRPADDDPRRGAYYGLTSVGVEVVRAEAERLEELLSGTEALNLSGRGSSR